VTTHLAARSLVAIALLVVAPVVTAWLVTKDAARSLSQLTPGPVAVTALVTETSLTRSTRVEISQPILPGPAVYGSGASGTITAVHVAIGDTVSAYDEIVSIDGITIRAWTSDLVLYRDLSSGARGDDVRAVQEFLGRVLGRTIPADGIFGTTTREAVVEYERSIGIQQPSGSVMHSWFVRVPEGLRVGELAVHLGRPAPGPADVLLRGAPTYGDLTIRPLSGPETVFAEGTYEFISTGRTVALHHDASGWHASDPEEFGALFATTDPELKSRTIEGRLREAHPGIGTAVPPSALVTQDGSTFCVVPATEPWKSLRVTPVTVGPNGEAIVADQVDHFPSRHVLVNPGEIAPDLPCPSS